MKKVLLVDDVRIILSIEKSMLNRQNLQLFRAGSGPEAIEIHKKEHVNLILLDMNMPGMNGDEVCRIIRNDDSIKEVSIIMAISSPNKEEIEKCMNVGANDYIIKPIDIKNILNKIGKYLSLPHRQSPRVSTRLEMKIKKGNQILSANTVNISTGGMLIEAHVSMSDFCNDDAVSIDMVIPENANTINIIGKVVRRVDNGKDKLPYLGVQFIDIAENDRKIIEKHIEKNFAMSVV